MVYLIGFVAAVPIENKEKYRQYAQDSVEFFKSYGVTRLVEAWGAEVPKGKQTDFYRAVDARDGEAIVYSFQTFPDKATAEPATDKMMADPKMVELGKSMPFDGNRVIWGQFDSICDVSGSGRAGFIDGSVIAVPSANREAYTDRIRALSELSIEHGAVRCVDAWGDDVPKGEHTDFYRAVAAEDDETIVMSWIEWPDKATRDAVWQGLFSHPLMQGDEKLFDENRRIFGGFEILVDQ